MKTIRDLLLEIGNRGGKLLYTVPESLVLYEIAGAPYIHVLKSGKGVPFLFKGDKIIATRLHLNGLDHRHPGSVEIFVFHQGIPQWAIPCRSISDAKSLMSTLQDRYGKGVQFEDRLIMRKTGSESAYVE